MVETIASSIPIPLIFLELSPLRKGADTYVLMNLGGSEVTARLQAETEAKAGVEMKFTFNMEKVSYFDADTGKRLN